MSALPNVPQPPIRVRVPDGGIFVPPSVQYLSTYVLLEQEDWFEKEIGFVRRVLQPGMRAIDVGANYGMYTLAMARAVAPGGAVWAFEPAEQTLNLLRQTVESNALHHVNICPVALSDQQCAGFLGIQGNSELNSLVPNAMPGAQPVQLETLQSQHAAHSMGSIDFIKLDAEGEELRIVGGAARLFREQSPLVMFELKAGEQINTALPGAFRDLGYQIYRLVGPDTLLVPVADAEVFDPFELNLFACKADRAASLAARGLLAEHIDPVPNSARGSGVAFWRKQAFAAGFPETTVLEDAVWADRYAYWRDSQNPPAARVAALRAAIDLLSAERHGAPLIQLAARARLLLESGARAPAVQLIGQILDCAARGAALGSGLVWPVSARYDNIRPVHGLSDWLMASVVQAYAREAQYSDYFGGAQYLPMLDWLQSTPYANAAIERRRQLQSLRSRRQARPTPSALLSTAGPDNLNPNLWIAQQR